MSTIAEFIGPRITIMLKERLRCLQKLNAPKIVVQKAEAVLENPLGQVSKIQQFGELEYVAAAPKQFRRGQGVEFTLSTGSKVWLIPGSYGLFLTDQEK